MGPEIIIMFFVTVPFHTNIKFIGVLGNLSIVIMFVVTVPYGIKPRLVIGVFGNLLIFDMFIVTVPIVIELRPTTLYVQINFQTLLYWLIMDSKFYIAQIVAVCVCGPAQKGYLAQLCGVFVRALVVTSR